MNRAPAGMSEPDPELSAAAQEHELTIAVIDLANIAYQHGREELSPWPAQWQKLQDRIIALAALTRPAVVPEPALWLTPKEFEVLKKAGKGERETIPLWATPPAAMREPAPSSVDPSEEKHSGEEP